jgi:hypothetical protein
MNEGTRSGKSTIRLLGISAERPTNGLYLLPLVVVVVVVVVVGVVVVVVGVVVVAL